MPETDQHSPRRGWLRPVAAWAGAAAVYAAAQGLSAWAGQRGRSRATRSQYTSFDQPRFAPPGWAFPVVWSALNLTTATSAWLVWRARDAERIRDDERAPGDDGVLADERARAEKRALAWWAAAVPVRSGYVPLAFGQGQLWAATADAALLSAVMARYTWLARAADPAAALLALPEVGWSAFATVLSAAVAAGNSGRRS